MRNSPRKRAGQAAHCTAPVEIASMHQLSKKPLGELRNLATAKHGIKSAALLRKPDVLEKLKHHFQEEHGLDVRGEEGGEPSHELSPISQTIDKLRSRIKEKQTGRDEPSENPEESLVGSALIELSEHVLSSAAAQAPPHHAVLEETIVTTEEAVVVVDDGHHHHLTDDSSVTVVQAVFDPSDVISEEVIENSGESLYEEYITSDVTESHKAKIETGEEEEEEEGSEEMTMEILEKEEREEVSSTVPDPKKSRPTPKHSRPRPTCHAYVVAKTVKELKDLGRDMLRIHAENHGIEHAGRLRMSELLKEMIEHYNDVHDAGLEISKLDMLKLNMLKLKKVKVDVREKTPPPDFTKLIPKNVVPLEEQVHHVYEKRPDVCTVDIIVNNLKDMLALGTSILRPEASKHRVANSSRKQKLQVVEELWEHYLKFHLRDTESSEVVEEEYESDTAYEEYQNHPDAGYIVVREEDIVQGEEILAVAEEVAE